MVQNSPYQNNILESGTIFEDSDDKLQRKGGGKMSGRRGGCCCFRKSCRKVVRSSRRGNGGLLLLLLGVLLAATTSPAGVTGASQNTNIINVNQEDDCFDDDYECDCHSQCCKC